jgi:hypothetical protein
MHYIRLQQYAIMKNIKTKLILVLAVGIAVIYSSCSKESKESCTPPVIKENIIGSWRSVTVGGEVEFKSDGTYVDDDEMLLGVEVNGLKYDQRTYKVNGDVLTLKVSPKTTNDSAVFEYDVVENKCNQIKLGFDFNGQTFVETLKKI